MIACAKSCVVDKALLNNNNNTNANTGCPRDWKNWKTVYFLTLRTGKTGKQYTFSPYGLEKLEKEKWINGSNFLL